MEVLSEDLSVNIGGFIRLDHPIMNAAGFCKNEEDVELLGRSSASAIVLGSVTLESRTGNSGEVLWHGERYSLNSLGMPNRGMDFYAKSLRRWTTTAQRLGKCFILSVAGFTPEEYGILAERGLNNYVDGIELNLGCPNVWDDGKQKRIASFSPEGVRSILTEVETKVGKKARVFVKLSPFSDPEGMREVVKVIAAFEVEKAVTTCNTFPNGQSFDNNGKPRIAVGKGYAGVSGAALKPIGLGQVAQLRDLLPERIQIIGVGGICCADDVRDYLRAGADAVQIGTAYDKYGPKIFSEILQDLVTDEVFTK